MTTNRDFFSNVKEVLKKGKKFDNKNEYYLFISELEYFFIEQFGKRKDMGNFEVNDFLDRCGIKISGDIPIVEPFDYTVYI